MLETFSAIDRDLLLFINGLNAPFLDTVMLTISSKLGWLLLYVILLYVIIRDFKKKSWLVLLLVAFTILISDQSSVHLFKNVFQRLRPCHDEGLAAQLHMVKYCGGKFGFVSSHAANSVALSAFLMLLLRKRHSWIIPVMVIYSVLIMYSRVYLGVHYPGDVIGGAILGIIIGWCCYQLFKLINKRI